MNKKITICIIISLIVILLLIKCFIINSDESKKLELTYQANGGVPYEWQYEIDDNNIVEFVKSYEVDNQNKDGLVGAPISTNYVFKGLKKGITAITFKYVNITDGTISKEEKNTVKVDENNNISLVEVN